MRHFKHSMHDFVTIIIFFFFCNFIIDSIDVSNIFFDKSCIQMLWSNSLHTVCNQNYLFVRVCTVQCALWFLDARKWSVGCQHLIDERSNKPAFLWSVRIIYCHKMDFDKWRSFHIWSNLVCGASMVFCAMNCFDCWSLVTIRYFKCLGCLSFLVCTFCCWHFCLQQLGCSVFWYFLYSCAYKVLACTLHVILFLTLLFGRFFVGVSLARDNNRLPFILLESKVFSAIFGSLCRRWHGIGVGVSVAICMAGIRYHRHFMNLPL